MFRLAVIAQQIYYRYYHKQTRNPAFKNFWLIVHALHVRCLKLMAQHTVARVKANASLGSTRNSQKKGQ